MVLQHLISGRLRRVLPGYTVPAAPLSVLYPRSRQKSPTVWAFMAGVAREAEVGWEVEKGLWSYRVGHVVGGGLEPSIQRETTF